jgi:hypothetical protein
VLLDGLCHGQDQVLVDVALELAPR